MPGRGLDPSLVSSIDPDQIDIYVNWLIIGLMCYQPMLVVLAAHCEMRSLSRTGPLVRSRIHAITTLFTAGVLCG